MKSWLAKWCLGVLLFLAAQPASAFKRTTDSGTGVCLYWKNSTMTYYIHEDCSDDIPNINDCIAAVRAGFDVWHNTGCTSFNAVYGGTTSRTDVGFDADDWDNNINLVIFIESGWSHESSAMALTTTTYDTEKGEIVDADVELNGQHFDFSIDDSPGEDADIHNTMSHEAGHTLGLDHSSSSQATMWATADDGELMKRDLDQDDIDAVCFVYPTDGKISIYTDDTLSVVCGELSEETGCRCNPPGNGLPSLAAWLGFIAAALLGLKLVRRSRGRSRS